MPDTFNPYVEWLGIERTACPPDHYALLGIKRFESDKRIIVSAAGTQLAKVRAVRPGGRLAEWQRVIDELTAAKNCLCDPTTKATYDKVLRERPVIGSSGQKIANGPTINRGDPRSERAQGSAAGDSKLPAQKSAGRNIMPPGKSDVGKQSGNAPADSVKGAAESLNPLPPTNPTKPETIEKSKPGSAVSKAANVPQRPATPGMRLPLPSAIPTTAMPTTTSAAVGSQGAAPHLPAGMPIQPMPMPGLAIPQQPAAGGIRPAGAKAASSQNTSEGSAGSAAILLADSALPAARRSAEQPAGSALSPLEQLGIGGEPEFRRKTGPQRRSRAPLIAVAIAFVAVVSVGLFIASKTRLGADLIAGGGTSTSSTTGRTQPATTSSSNSSTATTSPVKAADPPNAHSDTPGTQAKPKPAMKQTAGPANQAAARNDSQAGSTPPKQSRPFNPLLDQAPSDVGPPMQGPAKVDPPKVDTNKTELIKPMPDVVKQAPEAPADPVQAEKLRQMLADARKRLSERQPAEARKLIDAASQLATTHDQHEMVDRMDALDKYVDGFWSAVRDALRALKPEDEIEITSTRRYIVVEASADSLVLRTEGATKKYTVSQLPTGIAIALALRWFDPNKADNKVFIGAFHLVDPKTGPEYAKRDWNDAANAGVDVKNLLPLLEMEAPPAVAQADASPADKSPLPVPAKDVLDGAEKKLRAEMEADFADATTPQKKTDLAKKLIEQAASGNDPARRFVMCRVARDLAAEVGQPAVMVQAVDQMAAQFRIDPLDMKADTLAAFPPKSITTGRVCGEAALKLADEAVAAGRQALAGRYAQFAITAAQTARSVDLLRKAQKRSKEIQDAAKAEAGM